MKYTGVGLNADSNEVAVEGITSATRASRSSRRQ